MSMINDSEDDVVYGYAFYFVSYLAVLRILFRLVSYVPRLCFVFYLAWFRVFLGFASYFISLGFVFSSALLRILFWLNFAFSLAMLRILFRRVSCFHRLCFIFYSPCLGRMGNHII